MSELGLPIPPELSRLPSGGALTEARGSVCHPFSVFRDPERRRFHYRVVDALTRIDKLLVVLDEASQHVSGAPEGVVPNLLCPSGYDAETLLVEAESLLKYARASLDELHSLYDQPGVNTADREPVEPGLEGCHE